MDDKEKYTRFLGKEVLVEIDRPKGSPHPKLGFVYKVNYGYIPGTKAGDGHEIDAYILGVEEPLAQYRGKCIGIILRRDDDEHKLVVAPREMSRERIAEDTRFVEQYYDSEVLIGDA